LCAMAAAAALAAHGPAGPAAAGEPPAGRLAEASADARQVARWVEASGDNGGRPYAIVDKKSARLFVFAPDGRELGATPALLGEAVGDDTVPGVGDKPPSQVLPGERTTPAGRFVSEPGRNLSGEHVVWVEYDSGFAIHRVRPGASQAGRLQRLASPTPEDNRNSLGCVVVDVPFYESVVLPVLGQGRAVVYVLPETRAVSSVFDVRRLALQQR